MWTANRDCALEDSIGAQRWLRLLFIVTGGRLLREPYSGQQLSGHESLGSADAFAKNLGALGLAPAPRFFVPFTTSAFYKRELLGFLGKKIRGGAPCDPVD